MTAQNYYNNLDFIPLGDLIQEVGDDKITDILNTFNCSKNEDLQDFLHNPEKAIKLEKKHITRTYLYLEINDGNIKVSAYFSISLKILETDGLSGTLIKRLDGIDKRRDAIPCFLIAQLGKNTSCDHKIGQFLLDDAIDTIKDTNKIIGGRFIILDAVNVEKVIRFYSEEPNSFILLDKIIQDKENLTMYYPLI